MSNTPTDADCEAMSLSIARQLLLLSRQNDSSRLLGFLLGPSRLTRRLKADCARYEQNYYRTVLKGAVV